MPPLQTVTSQLNIAKRVKVSLRSLPKNLAPATAPAQIQILPLPEVYVIERVPKPI